MAVAVVPVTLSLTVASIPSLAAQVVAVIVGDGCGRVVDAHTVAVQNDGAKARDGPGRKSWCRCSDAIVTPTVASQVCARQRHGAAEHADNLHGG
jgi:hypothetical protein